MVTIGMEKNPASGNMLDDVPVDSARRGADLIFAAVSGCKF